MKDQYSEAMQKLMRKQPKPIVHGVFLSLLILLLIGAVYGTWDINRQEEAHKKSVVEFVPYQSDPVYSQLKPDFMLPEFAISYDERVYYCFTFSKDLKLSIVAVWAENMGVYQELIDYTLSEEMNLQEPEPVVLQGIPVKLDEDMIDMAVEAYNTFMGNEMINSTNYQLVIGNYYLDTTQGPETESGLLLFCITFFILVAAFYLILVMNSRNKENVRKRTLSSYDSQELKEIDLEVTDTSIQAYDDIIFTKNYMLSDRLGFEIVPYNEVVHVYGKNYGGVFDNIRGTLVAETRDGITHEFAIKRDGLRNPDENPVLNEMKLRMPDIRYGFEHGFVNNTVEGFQVEVDSDEEENNKKSNILLGILGAVLGATLGGILWVLIGFLGFIAGLAGYFMMYFAIIGYRRLSGFLDKKGQIIALIIAVIMIFVANYALYVLEFAKALYGNYSVSSIGAAIRGLPGFLSTVDGWTDFIKDLAIGYGLSAIASVNMLRSIFSK